MSTRLKAARAERGWSQPQLIRALVARAREDGVALPELSSLKTMVSRWENGKARPDQLYSRLLRQVYGLTDDELGLVTDASSVAVHTATDELIRQLDAAGSVTAEMVGRLQDQTDLFRTLDRPFGAPPLLEQMRGHLGLLSDLLHDGVLACQRQPIAAVLADAAALAGWQALDVGAAAQAWQHFETAKAAAREAGDDALLAYATAEQAYVLMDLDRAQDAVALTEQALNTRPRGLPRLVRCWLHGVEGEALAMVGDELGALRAFDRAAAALTTEGAERAQYVVLNDAHLARWRGNALARIGHRDALACLTQALAGMDGSFRRATASLHCDLAIAYLDNQDREAARAHAGHARSLAAQVGSVRQMRRVERLPTAA